MTAIHLLVTFIAIGLGGIAGCRSSAPIQNPIAAPIEVAPEARTLEASAALQRILEVEADALQSEFSGLKQRGEWNERGYFDGPEHDAIETLLLRFVINQGAFWGEFDRLGGAELLRVDEAVRPRAHVLALHVGLSLADSSAFLISSFQDDKVAIAKLNEAFYRSEIPRNSYDRLRLAATSEVRQQLLTEAWSKHREVLAEPDSPLAVIAAENDDFAALLAGMPRLHERVMGRLEQIREHESTALNGARSHLEHSEVAKARRASGQAIGDVNYQTRALVFAHVSRIQSPAAKLIAFTPEQKQQIFSALEPGDLLLTYTAGYVSSVFIPGEFKHGITYVADTATRRAAGLALESLPELAIPERERFAANLQRDRMPNGGRADLIEAVAEGVKFSDLDYILDTHINRLLILRPVLSRAERASFLAGVFAYLGDPYDFRFDFADASRQVCTEVIYRALQGKAGFTFELTSRGGNPTLSADDIVHYHLSDQPGQLDFVLLAEKDPEAEDQRARILEGEEGKRRLREMMGEKGGEEPGAKMAAD